MFVTAMTVVNYFRYARNELPVEKVPFLLKLMAQISSLACCMSLLVWVESCAFALRHSLEIFGVLYLAVAMFSFALWLPLRTASVADGWRDHIYSFYCYFLNLLTFLTRVSQVVVVFWPLEGLNYLERHAFYTLVMIVFAQIDAILAMKGKKYCLCSCFFNSDQEKIDDDAAGVRSWAQCVLAVVKSLVGVLLALYRTVWMALLLVPGLGDAVLHCSPGRLSLRIFSIVNLLSFCLTYKPTSSAVAAKTAAAAAVERRDGYVPLQGDGDVEMCAPAAVIHHSEPVQVKAQPDSGMQVLL